MKIIQFDIDLLGEKILVCISQDINVLKKIIPKFNFSSYGKTHLGLAFSGIHKDKIHRRVIWLRKWDIDTLIHEAYHITSDILENTGIADQETGAYIIEFICQKTIKCYKN